MDWEDRPIGRFHTEKQTRIRTRDPSRRAVKGVTRLRPCGHCDRPCCVLLRENKYHDPDDFHFARQNHNLSFCDIVSVVGTASLYRVVP
jgi:hypothetical protein